MIEAWGRIGAAVLAALMLQACADGGGLMNLSSASDTPDEFAILPAKGLEIPEDLAALPAPAPGGTNLAAVDALGAGVRALGGDPGGGVVGSRPARACRPDRRARDPRDARGRGCRLPRREPAAPA